MSWRNGAIGMVNVAWSQEVRGGCRRSGAQIIAYVVGLGPQKKGCFERTFSVDKGKGRAENNRR